MDLTSCRFLMDRKQSVGILCVPTVNYFFFTMELPWLDNRPDVSCVPAAKYALVPHNTPEHPNTWALVNPAAGVYHEPGDIPAGTTGRYACLLHPFNWAHQAEGCVGPGLGFNGVDMVLSSDLAFQEIQTLLRPGSTGHTLTILEKKP